MRTNAAVTAIPMVATRWAGLADVKAVANNPPIPEPKKSRALGHNNCQDAAKDAARLTKIAGKERMLSARSKTRAVV